MVDQVVHRFDLRATLSRILDLLQRPDRADGGPDHHRGDAPPGDGTAAMPAEALVEAGHAEPRAVT